jgi:hypothetical protein
MAEINHERGGAGGPDPVMSTTATKPREETGLSRRSDSEIIIEESPKNDEQQ